MFVLHRSSFKITVRFYIAFAVILILSGVGAAWLGALLTMHVHLKPTIAPKNAPDGLASREVAGRSPKETLPEHVPECDLPPCQIDKGRSHTKDILIICIQTAKWTDTRSMAGGEFHQRNLCAT